MAEGEGPGAAWGEGRVGEPPVEFERRGCGMMPKQGCTSLVSVEVRKQDMEAYVQ